MLEALFVPVIAILSASPAARAQCRPSAAQMIELSQHNAGASWLNPILVVLDREPILVIEPDTGLGFVGRMSGISSNFQLPVLLMACQLTFRCSTATASSSSHAILPAVHLRGAGVFCSTHRH